MEKDNVKLLIKKYPLSRSNENIFLHYNLYVFDPQKGTEQSIPLKYPCVREGCSTTCYFQAKTAHTSIIDEPCLYCGNVNSKIYLDIGFKQFIAVNFKYITSKTPLDVEINSKTNEFYFSSTNIKNTLLSKISNHIGESLVKELAFDEIPLIYKKMLDFWAIDKELSPIFAPEYKKKNIFLYGFCKYHPQPQEQTDKNYLLLFLFGKKEPLKVCLLDEESKNISSNKVFLDHCKVGFLAESNTFVVGVPKKEGMKYFVSCLDLHFNRFQETMTLIEQKDWKDEVARYGCSLIVDQGTQSVYVIGGFDSENNKIPDYLLKFQNCRWVLKNEKYHFLALIKTTYNESTPKYMKKQVSIINCSFSLQTLERPEMEGPCKFLYSLGGTVKDYDFFSSGYQKNQKSNIRYFNLDPQSNNSIIYEKNLKELAFPHKNYIIFQIPEMQEVSYKQYHRYVLVFGGQKYKDQESCQEDENLKAIYLVNKERPNFSEKLTETFEYGHLLSTNLDNFASLLFDRELNRYYIRGTYPLKSPIKVGNGKFVHYIVIEFDLKSRAFRAIPGAVEQI